MSITLLLEGISCHIKEEFTFTRGKLTLIIGPSGIGKSSIFKALTHALYGNVKGICNFNLNKYTVTLTTPEIKVVRCNKSPKLQVQYQGVLYDEEQTAQAIINKHFGSEDMWNVSCYLEQDSRSALLGGSNSDRMEILNRLSFWEDNPDKYLERIDMEIKYQQDLFMRDQERYRAEAKLYEDEIKENAIDYQYSLTKEQIGNLEIHLSKCITNLQLLTVDLDNQNKIIGSIDVLRNKLNQNMELKKGYNSIDYKKEIQIVEFTLASLGEKRDQLNYNINNNSKDVISVKNQLELKERELQALLNQKNSYLNSLKMYESSLNNINSQLKSLAELININYVDMSKYPNINLEKVNRKDLYDLIEADKIRNISKEKCKMLSIKYDNSEVNQFIIRIKNKINELTLYNSDLEVLDNIKLYEAKILELKLIPEYNLDQINQDLLNSEKKYNDMMLSKNLHKCPHCYKPIRYFNGEPVKENATIYSKEEISTEETKLIGLRDIKKKLELKKTYNDYVKQFISMLKIISKETYNIPSDINDLEKYKSALQIAEEIKIIPDSIIDANELNKILNYQEVLIKYNSFDKSQCEILESNINKIKSEICKFPNNIETELNNIKDKIKNIETNISKVNEENRKNLQNLQDEIQILDQKKVTLQRDMNNLDFIEKEGDKIKSELIELNAKIIPDLKEKYVKLNEEINTLKLWQLKATQILKVNQKYEILKKKETELNERNKKLGGLYALRQTTFDLECNHLQTTVDSINESLNDILQNIFEKPIKVILNLYKKNKSNDKIRANVNLSIQYDGNEYDSIHKLSGGEKDRISFALTLAISRINGSEFLLLDETLRSLNDDYRTLCLEAMRNFFGTSKTILCINHQDVEGHYDEVIRL